MIQDDEEVFVSPPNVIPLFAWLRSKRECERPRPVPFDWIYDEFEEDKEQ